MIDPMFGFVFTTALLVTGLVLAAASTGVAIAAAQSQARAAEDIGEYNAEVARNNAQAARDQSQFQADRIRDRARRTKGAQRAAYSKSGVELSGTVEDVMFDSAIEFELEAISALYKGTVASNSQTAQSEMFKLKGEAARTQGNFAIAGSILGGLSQATSLSSNYTNAQALSNVSKPPANPTFQGGPTV